VYQKQFYENLFSVRYSLFACLLLYVGTHDELIKDVDGAYFQLIRLQKGAKEAEGSHNSEAERSSSSFNLDIHMARSSTQRAVSISRGSSGRHSQSHSFSLSHQSGVHEIWRKSWRGC